MHSFPRRFFPTTLAVLAALFLGAITPCPPLAAQGDMEGLEAEPAPIQVDPAVEKALLAAVNAYLKADESPLAGKVTIQVDSMDGATYRLLVLPDDPESGDFADAYVRKGDDGKWKVLGLGTGFDEEFYERAKIPQALRDPVEPEIFLPLKEETTAQVIAALKEALGGKEIAVEKSVQFTDYYSQDSGKAVHLLVTGNEKVTGTAAELHKISTKVFTGLGWKEDTGYRSEGPSGVNSMYRGPENAFAFFTAVWNPSEDSGLSEEDDPTLANLKPEQKIYRVEWYLGQPAPGQTLSKPTLDPGTGDGGDSTSAEALESALPSE